MQTKLTILILVLLGVSACDMEKKFQNIDYQIYNELATQLRDHGCRLWNITEDSYSFWQEKLIEEHGTPYMSEEVFAKTMSIVSSYGIDTKKFDRKSVLVYYIRDYLYNIDSPAITDSCDLFEIQKLKVPKNVALVRYSDYRKHIIPLLSKQYQKQYLNLEYLIGFSLSDIVLDSSKTNGYFEIIWIGEYLCARGIHYIISKRDGKWHIDQSYISMIS